MLHALALAECETLGPIVKCTEKAPAGLVVRVVSVDGDGIWAEHAGQRRMLVVCEGCLARLIGGLLPPGAGAEAVGT